MYSSANIRVAANISLSARPAFVGL